ANGRGAPRAPKMSSRYFDKIEMHPNYPYSSSFHTKTRRASTVSACCKNMAISKMGKLGKN
ncbi:MAG: hypothetical protein EWV55_11115, partial [Microcystis viridis Mv_BB_P_19951000_S69]